MEGAPATKTESNVESLVAWRELKSEAPAQAERLMAQIDGFEEMELKDKIAELKQLLSELSDNNDNRFLVEEIAKRVSVMEEHSRHSSRLAELQLTA
ncbi:hypothetical protein H6784_04330 [Candidatus Nomurabacteria bacterium]|nr:hypothetical protein [Candidatus Nomurabacteria bacterium]